MNSFRILLSVTTLGLLMSVWSCLLHDSNAFQPQQKNHAVFARSSHFLNKRHHQQTSSTNSIVSALSLSSTPLWSSPADADPNNSSNTNNKPLKLRDRLRQATGFSLTVFRATLRGITGISLTAIYASTIAVTGLWIRKVTSILLSVFPSWFRYFLQPFLVLYYAPLFIIRNLTGPTRQRARQQHASVLEGWKDAVEYAEQTKQDGYWPVVVSDDGYFEMVAPPNPNDTTQEEVNKQFSKAMAHTVEQAMEVQEDTKREGE